MTKKTSDKKKTKTIAPARRVLLAALQKTSRRAMAKRMKVSIAAVSRWASGISKPNQDSQKLLKTSYGIEGNW